MEFLSPYTISAIGALVFCGSALLGYLLAQLGRGELSRKADESERLKRRLAQIEHQSKEHSRMVALMRREQDTLSSLALSLPHVVQELNRGDLETKDIPKLIFNLAEAIFQPVQLLFYEARPKRGKSNSQCELHLQLHRGLDPVPREIQRIAFGQGKIGWVAEHKLDRLHDDWHSLAMTDGMQVEHNNSSLKLDIIGPLMHHTSQGEQVLGVLCIGEPTARPRNEKLMFQMVTNLGSLALVNAMNVNKLREQANHDGLTGLLNKSFFMHELAIQSVNLEREAKQYSLFIFDIDHFKTYNDTNGHPAGDELLRSLAGLLEEQMRPGDLCCRYGGEEFLVALPLTGPQEAMEIAEEIRLLIQNHVFKHQENQPGGNLTISGGVATYPLDGHSLEELIKNADQALYKSKEAGRNAVTRYKGLGLTAIESDADYDMIPSIDEV